MILAKSIRLLNSPIAPPERVAGQDDSSVVENSLIFEGLCESNNIPKNQLGRILHYVLKDDV